MMLRQVIKSLIRENKEKTASSKDMIDAWEVFRDYMYQGGGSKVFARPKSVKERLTQKEKFFKAKHNIQKIPLAKVKVFMDWERRPKGKRLENTIVVIKLPGGKYQALDGQHRVLALKEKGRSHVMASVVDLPLKKR